jgi:hypothetical protein
MDPTESPSVPTPDDEEEIIELTEVVAEAPTEVLLELGAEVDELAGLKPRGPGPLSKKPRADQVEASKSDSLDDLLASLPDLTEDLEVPAKTPVKEAQPRMAGLQEMGQLIPEAELKEMVREVIQETVERLARELLPGLAAQVLERQFLALKKRLLED